MMKSNLPERAKQWSERVATEKVQAQTIHTAAYRNSGSQIGLKQFLLLRALWPQKRAAQSLENPYERRRLLSDSHLDAARKFLAALPSWDQYLQSFGKSLENLRREGFAGLDTFAVARLYQINAEGVEGSISVPKLDFTPVAQRTRARKSGRQDQDRPKTPPTPTPGPRGPSGAQIDIHGELAGEEPARSHTEAVDEIATDVGDLSLLESSHHISPFSPLATDVAQYVKAVGDEEIVNMALLVWLDSLTVHCADVNTNWSPERRAFLVRDQNAAKIYEARVDGLLYHRNHQDVLAIIEVKPFLRSSNLDAVQMQEAAQMAAWISQHPPSSSSDLLGARGKGGNDKFRYVTSYSSFLLRRGTTAPFYFNRTFGILRIALLRRLLISQDRDEIYLTVASFDTDYVEYICGKKNTATSFLEMRPYGGFNTGSASHMRGLGELILAFCLQCSS